MQAERTEILHATFDRKMPAMAERRVLRQQGKDVVLRRCGDKWGVYIIKREARDA